MSGVLFGWHRAEPTDRGLAGYRGQGIHVGERSWCDKPEVALSGPLLPFVDRRPFFPGCWQWLR